MTVTKPLAALAIAVSALLGTSVYAEPAGGQSGTMGGNARQPTVAPDAAERTPGMADDEMKSRRNQSARPAPGAEYPRRGQEPSRGTGGSSSDNMGSGTNSSGTTGSTSGNAGSTGSAGGGTGGTGTGG